MWPFKKDLPPPPVSHRLREMLKDYPELIQTLQEDLNSVITDPFNVMPPFEVAVWRLEDALDTFIFEARKELEAAKASGDVSAIEQADKKERLMSFARSSGGGMRNLSELRRYFQAYDGGL